LDFLVSYAYGVSLQQVLNVPSSFMGPGAAFDVMARCRKTSQMISFAR
jgi:hypothetical protein